MRRGTSKAQIVVYRGHRYRRYPRSKHQHLRRYFHATERRRGFLHRHMWEDARGPIPEGHEIHHKDENCDNNTLDNFECLTVKDHRNRHPIVGERLKRQRRHLRRIGPLAAQWHGSPAGRKWHLEHAKRHRFGHFDFGIAKCKCCRGKFRKKTSNATFCSGACDQRYRIGGPDWRGRRIRGRYARDGEKIRCRACRERFITKWPESTMYCSTQCKAYYGYHGAPRARLRVKHRTRR
jgi:hypothetical protein